MEKKFKIDFFELAFLVEACIPPVPIARGMLWDEVINEYYHQMTPEERIRLWEWLNKNHNYKYQLEKGNEEVEVFEARFNPDNQYRLVTKEKTYDTFKIGEEYYIIYYPGSRRTSIVLEEGIKIEKLEYDRGE
jgi:hypothetical protein